LEALYSVATIANEVLELPMMLEKMLVQTLQAIGVSYGAIHLLNTDEEVLHLVAQVGISPQIVQKISTITTGFGLTGWVAQQKHPLTLMNVSNDPRMLAIGQVSGYSQFFSAPLISQNHLLGVISVFGDTSQQLNPERIALLTTISDQIGIAVEGAQLRAQAEQAAILEERQRVARELHDSVTQSLYSLTLLAAAGQRSAQDGSQERTLRNLDSISTIAFQTLKEMRLLVYELQPSILGNGKLTEAIQRRLDSVEEHSGMQTKLIIEDQIQIPQPIELELYGFAQEALNNSIKHGAATSVTVRLSKKDESIILEISDDGKGFDLQQAEKKHGSGIISMKKRVNNLGGRINIITALGKGTIIQAIVPINFDNEGPMFKDIEGNYD
jgi:signal transduction histidine kinase